MVLALPEFGTEITKTGRRNGKAAWTRSDRSDAQRGASMPFHSILPTAGQNYENGWSDRLPALVAA